MATSKNEFICSVCQNLYTHPVVHRLCGNSFDRQCIKNICPAQECGKVVKDGDLLDNHALSKNVDGYRLKLDGPPTYYLILLDSSTSMRYSDALLPFAIGESRFSCATKFLNEFFNIHMGSLTTKISLYTFDTSTLQRFDFETIHSNHLTMLQNLKCEGKDTALFDSIDFCLDRLEQLKKILKDQMPISYLFILTDGGNNFGRKESDHAGRIAHRSGKLQIFGHMIQIGDTNRKRTRIICDFLKYKYNHYKGGNVTEFVNSFTSTIRTEARARVATNLIPRAQFSRARSVTSADASIIDQLPDVPTHQIQVSTKKQAVLA